MSASARSTRTRASARARDHAHEPRARGRRGHRQDDAARGPHRVARAPGAARARRDRGRHLHRERRHHHEAAAARAARARAGRRRASAPTERAPRRGRARRARARAGLDHPRALRRAPAGAAARVRRAARLPRGRRGARPTSCFAEAWDEWLAERLARRRRGPDRGARRAASRWRATALGRAHARCAAWRARSSSSATSRRSSRRATVDPDAWRARAAREGRARRARSRRRSRDGRRAGGAARGARRVRGEACALPRGRTSASHVPAAASPTIRGELRLQAALAVAGGARRGARRSPAGPRTPRPRWTAALGADLHARLVARAARASVAALRAAQDASAGVLDFLDLLLKARDALRDRASVRALLPRALPLPDHRRVPGHRPAAGGDRASSWPASEPGRAGGGGRRQAVDLPLPPRRGARSSARLAEEAAARAGPRGAAPHPELPLAARHPALRQPRVRGADPGVRGRATSRPTSRSPPPPGLAEEPSVIALRFAARLRRGRRPAARRGRRARRASSRGRGGRRTRCATRTRGELRPSRAGDVMVLARRLTQVRCLEEALEARGPALRGRGRQVVLRPPGGARDAGRAARARRPVRPRRAGGRAALVVLRRERPRHRAATRSRAAAGSGFGAIDETRPGAAALAPALRAAAGAARAAHARLGARAARAALRRDAHPGRAHRHAPRRGADREPREGGGARAPGGGAGRAHRCAASRASWRSASASAREEPDLPATRPGDPDTVRMLSIHKAKGLEAPIVVLFDTADDADVRRPTRSRCWDEGTIAIGFRAGCQPPGWDVLTAGEEARARAEGAAPALRRLHARARPAGDPVPAGGRADRRLLEASCRRACRTRRTPTCAWSTRTRCRARARGARRRPRGAGGRRGRRRARGALGRASGAS